MKKTILFLFFILTTTSSQAQCFTKIKGTQHSRMLLKNDSTLWCSGWNQGSNPFGTSQIGFIELVQYGTATDWSDKFAISETVSLAIKTNGTLWACGIGSNNGLGVSVSTPTQVGTDTNWKDIAIGAHVSAGIKTDGTLWTWGQNILGALGTGNLNEQLQPTPAQVGTDTNWDKIFVNYRANFAIKTDGTLWTWGKTFSLGYNPGETTLYNAPHQVGVATNWKSITGYEAYAFGLQIDGTLWAWGSNSGGIFGNGITSSTIQYTPIQIGTENNWSKLSSHNFHCQAIKTDGSLWSWGTNSGGNLGNGTTINHITPQQMGNDFDWMDVSAGFGSFGQANTMAIKNNLSLYVWGRHLFTSISSPSISYVPVEVFGACALNNVQFTQSELQVYPNPFTSNFELNLSSINSDKVLIKVYDMLGKLVEEKDLYLTDEKVFLLGENYLPSIYNIVIYDAEEIRTIRVVKK